MPYPNEHACRLEEPGQFVRFSRDNDKNPNVIIGYRKDGTSAAQSFRYPKAKWTADKARAHCAEHKGSFEAASETKAAANGVERRCFEADELRVMMTEGDGLGPKMIVGHAAVFNRVAELGWFREQIAPGAFADAIGRDDVRALMNHDPNLVLGRNRAKTLRMTEDARGLAVEIDPPDTSYAQDLMVSIQRGDISQMSFGFQAVKDSWDRSDPENPLRTLMQVRLFDVSPVTFPAYADTDVAARSMEAWVATQPQIIRRTIIRARARFLDTLVRCD